MSDFPNQFSGEFAYCFQTESGKAQSFTADAQAQTTRDAENFEPSVGNCAIRPA